MAKQDRGFASMDLETKRRIASLGGKAAHAKGRAHKWTREEARQAGLRSVAQRRLRKAAEDAATAAGQTTGTAA